MSYEIEASNVTGQNRNFPLRRLDSKGNGYLQSFRIPAYALNHKLTFTSENEYKKWAKDYEDYISGKNAIIKIGKASGHSLERQNKDVVKENSKKLKEDQSKLNNNDEDMGIKTEVGSMSGDKEGDKK